MKDFESLYQQVLLVISPYQLILAFGFVLGSLVFRKILLYALNRYGARLTRLTKTDLDDLLLEALKKPIGMTVVLIGLYFAVHSFNPPSGIEKGIDTVFSLIIVVLLCWFMLRLVNVLTIILHRWAEKTDTTLDNQLVPLVSRAAKIAVGILAGLMIFQNMGYSISGLIAGLGVGGLAVALAAQKTLSDLFGSVMLLVDRPFVIGDWIRSPDRDIEGVVEQVGFRSTRIRTFDQTLITIPNSRLAEFVIDNVNLRPARRVWITVRVPHYSTAEQMRTALQRIQAYLKAHPGVDQDSFLLVKFTDFGEYSRDIMVYYFTKSTAWEEHLRVREEINLKFMELLEEIGLRIALPTQNVQLDQRTDSIGKA